MCRTTAYKSLTCNHRWLTITTRCAPNTGFTTTPVHDFHNEGSLIWGKPNFMRAPAGSCPNCDLKGQYDGNTTRLVLGSGEREIQRNIWRSGQGGLVGIVGGCNSMCGRPDVTPLGVYHQQQQSLDGDKTIGAQYCPVAQRYTYGHSHGRGPGLGSSGCVIM